MIEPGGEADFDLMMRRHRIDVLPAARELARCVFEDLTSAAQLVRQSRQMKSPAAYIFTPEAILRRPPETE